MLAAIMSKTVIRVKGLSKRYNLGMLHRETNSFRDGLTGLFKRHSKQKEAEIVWALKDVSFELKEGEILGIIGSNGAGKSTLLKILSRITKPDVGEAVIDGRVGSLLEVGTGFHPELTGRENIYLNGAILGMRRFEIKRKFDEIVAFAEVEKFLDTPVKRYSSGMHVRLAFAVAAHLEPEILLIDEVLAVGDASFQKKCLGKIGAVSKEGRTVLFVSHNMGAINRLCQRAIWIDSGSIHMNGLTDKVISSYLTLGSIREGERIWPQGTANVGIDEFAIDAIRILNGCGKVASQLDIHSPFFIEVTYRIKKKFSYCRIGVLINTIMGVRILETYDIDNNHNAEARIPGCYTSRCKVPANLLNTGCYTLSINAGIPKVKNLALIENVIIFDLEDTDLLGTYTVEKRGGVLYPALDWKIEANS